MSERAASVRPSIEATRALRFVRAADAESTLRTLRGVWRAFHCADRRKGAAAAATTSAEAATAAADEKRAI